MFMDPRPLNQTQAPTQKEVESPGKGFEMRGVGFGVQMYSLRFGVRDSGCLTHRDTNRCAPALRPDQEGERVPCGSSNLKYYE